MVINSDKTKIITVGTKARIYSPHNNPLSVKINGYRSQVVKTSRILGVIADIILSWKDQYNNITAKASRSIRLLRRIKRYFPIEARKLFYNAHINSTPTYCFTIRGSGSQGDIEVLKLQKRSLRVILDVSDIITSSKPLCKNSIYCHSHI